jgi:hypothetical protein
MYTNQRRARPCVSDDSVMHDLRISVLCASVSQRSISHIVLRTGNTRSWTPCYLPVQKTPAASNLLPSAMEAVSMHNMMPLLRWSQMSAHVAHSFPHQGGHLHRGSWGPYTLIEEVTCIVTSPTKSATRSALLQHLSDWIHHQTLKGTLSTPQTAPRKPRGSNPPCNNDQEVQHQRT